MTKWVLALCLSTMDHCKPFEYYFGDIGRDQCEAVMEEANHHMLVNGLLYGEKPKHKVSCMIVNEKYEIIYDAVDVNIMTEVDNHENTR